MHWLSTSLYMEGKFEPLEKRIKKDGHQSRRNISKDLPATPFLAKKRNEEISE